MIESLNALPYVLTTWFLLATLVTYTMVLLVDVAWIAFCILAICYLTLYSVCDMVGVTIPVFTNVLLLLLAALVMVREHLQ